MPPAGTDVIAPALQRHQHEVGGLEGPLVGGCGQHDTVQVPSGQGHCESSDVRLCAFGGAAYEGFRARALRSKYRPGDRVGM
jgi:hypothetical protein